jgi:hypothetical protein
LFPLSLCHAGNENATQLIDLMRVQERTWQEKFHADSQMAAARAEQEKQQLVRVQEEERRKSMEYNMQVCACITAHEHVIAHSLHATRFALCSVRGTAYATDLDTPAESQWIACAPVILLTTSHLAHARVHKQTHTHTHTRAHAHIHTHTHTRTHTRARTHTLRR